MFYEQFAKICKERGETPSSIVQQLGLSTSKVTAWKNGSIPKASLLEALAGILKVKVADFFLEGMDVIITPDLVQNYKILKIEKGLSYANVNTNARCPHCGEMIPNTPDFVRYAITSFEDLGGEEPAYRPYLVLTMRKCQSEKCGKYSVSAKGMLGYNTNPEHFDYDKTPCYGTETTYIYPKSDARPVPRGVPNRIKIDYQEACAIRHLSVKAAAALCRRCIHSMMIDFFDIIEENQRKVVSKYEKSLIETRKELACIWDNPNNEKRRFLSQLIVDTIPGFCKIGDKGSHADAISNAMYDEDEQAGDLVSSMISFIEDRFADWYERRENERISYGKLSEKGKEIVAAEKADLSKQSAGEAG
jgi:transcriptional regulator with XRE-family HTH domain